MDRAATTVEWMGTAIAMGVTLAGCQGGGRPVEMSGAAGKGDPPRQVRIPYWVPRYDGHPVMGYFYEPAGSVAERETREAEKQ